MQTKLEVTQVASYSHNDVRAEGCRVKIPQNGSQGFSTAKPLNI
jgi:hypothetical protein